VCAHLVSHPSISNANTSSSGNNASDTLAPKLRHACVRREFVDAAAICKNDGGDRFFSTSHHDENRTLTNNFYRRR
jgi:hypothetical protein